METTVTSLYPILNICKLQTELFKNVTADITDEKAGIRLQSTTNHIAWLTGHIVSNRFLLATVLGTPVKEPFPEFFARGKGIDPNIAYPSMTKLTEGWEQISEKMISRLEQLKEWEILAEAPISTPMTNFDPTLRGFITFMVQHEAYHIGQIGIARKFFNYEPMAYP